MEAEVVALAVKSHLSAFDVDASGADVALALAWDGAPEYQRLHEFARGLLLGLAERTARGLPVYLLLDADIAHTLGRLLRDELGLTNDLLVLDGVRLWDFDYIDLGSVRQPSNTVPVTIKSLRLR